MKIRKVLVANRGEIAVRVIRACRGLGLKTVAVYSEPDRASVAVRLADEAVPIGPAVPLQSYLSIVALLEAARRTGADAVHPGYGFLSENALFVRACEEKGIRFIGPSSHALSRMSDKVSARVTAREASVPTVPGEFTPIGDQEDLHRRARSIGFPLILKAVGGGGGKGMRIVNAASELDAAFAIASSEVTKAFGSSAIYAEKFLPGARHIEIQVVGDGHGGAIHLGERECSVQRRYQKLIEEAPSPFMTPDLRQAMGAAAVRLVRKVGYDSVGTCEFLVEESGAFHFLEMNTRLQVEHPVTEMTTGIDLVQLQIEIAGGEPIPYRQEDVGFRGHAIEARICAEDPSNQFLPSAGIITDCDLPSGPYIRVDSGLFRGQEVSLFYDPILAKVIAWGPDREAARRRLRDALSEVRVSGVRTTAPFLRALVEHAEFVAGRIDTGFVARIAPQIGVGPSPDGMDRVAAIAAAVLRHRSGRRSPTPENEAESRAVSNWVLDARRRSVQRHSS